MELQIIGFIAAAGLFVHAIYLRVCYFKHEAICLENTPHGKRFMSSALYEYELLVAEKKITYKNWGWTYFHPRKGKRYKVLICKKDYSKVNGYMLYMVHLILGGGLATATLIVDILW